MKNTKKNIERKLFFSHVLSDDVFHIIFDNVYLKILSRFLDYLSCYSITRRPTNDR